MLTLVRRARRRLFCNELFSQGANAVSAALAVFILLLLLGTQILSWHWLVLLPLAAAALGLYLARRRVPSPYVVAQLIDHRIGLADALSTAIFFESKEAGSRTSEPLREPQRETAERAAASVDLRRAMPYILPRSVYLMAALVLVASSLFALRYVASRSLDLRPPLARILRQSFGEPERTRQAHRNRRKLPPDAQPQDQDDETTLTADQQAAQQDQSPEAESVERPDAQPGKSDKKNSADRQAGQEDQAEPGKPENQDGQQGEESGDDAAKQDGRDGNPKGSKQDSASRQDSNPENSSLLSKVKDAMKNLLSRMKSPQGQSGSQQSSMEQGSKQGKGQQSSGKQQSAQNGQQKSEGQQTGEQEGQAGEEADNSQDPQGKGTGKNDSQQASKQPGSGVGSQDGDKNIRQAEQLAAMGKISEIIGKRAANITGETTVEVQNTNQVLHTPYAQRGAQHSQGGAEINRDEIPVALQGYVEQYFEQVRHPAPAPKK